MVKLDVLKTIQPYYIDLKKGLKTFEVRKNDRDFQVNQYIFCALYHDGKFGDEGVLMRVGYILDNPEFCKEGFVILGGFSNRRVLYLPPGYYDWEHYILDSEYIQENLLINVDTTERDKRLETWKDKVKNSNDLDLNKLHEINVNDNDNKGIGKCSEILRQLETIKNNLSNGFVPF